MGAGLRMWNSREKPEDFSEAHGHLVRFCTTELVPHLDRDQHWLLQAQTCPEGHLLAQAMLAEVQMMVAAVYGVVDATAPCEAMAQTRVLHTLLAAHDHHEILLRSASVTA